MLLSSARRGRAIPTAATLGLLVAVLAAPTQATAAQAAVTPAAATPAAPPPFTIEAGPNFTHLPAPLSTSDCLTYYGIRRYTPTQLHVAYDLNPLYRRHIDGRGVTIVVPIPFGSPTIRHDLHVYDRQFHLPDPQLRIIQFGDIPPYDPTSAERIEWAAGTTLVVETAHAIAPRATIVIAETMGTNDVATDGFGEILAAERSLIDAGVADVIAQIEAGAESDFPGVTEGDPSSLLALRGTYQAAAAGGVTVLASAGNSGVRTGWPSTDPLVTSVGGSELYLDDAGRALRPPTTWNDGFGAAGGGGLSAVFARPAFQDGVRDVVGDSRGAPDIAMSSSIDGGGWVYASFGGTGGVGWDIFDATGEAMSLFAGVVALADQLAGQGLGRLGPALYRLGARAEQGKRNTGLVDITEGDTSHDGLVGHQALPGYDLATGWGTIDAAAFVPALARAVARQHHGRPAGG